MTELTFITSTDELSVITEGAGADIVVMAEVGLPGRDGLPGTPGTGGGIVHQQVAPSASWIIAHGLGRLPAVSVYLADGEQVEADVQVTTTIVNITFATANSGFAVIT